MTAHISGAPMTTQDTHAHKRMEHWQQESNKTQQVLTFDPSNLTHPPHSKIKVRKVRSGPWFLTFALHENAFLPTNQTDRATRVSSCLTRTNQQCDAAKWQTRLGGFLGGLSVWGSQMLLCPQKYTEQQARGSAPVSRLLGAMTTCKRHRINTSVRRQLYIYAAEPLPALFAHSQVGRLNLFKKLRDAPHKGWKKGFESSVNSGQNGISPAWTGCWALAAAPRWSKYYLALAEA